MANAEKHKKDTLQEWLEGGESGAPTHSRSVRTVGSFVKLGKPAGGKARSLPTPQSAPLPEPAVLREPAPPPKHGVPQTQASSRDHLLKLKRLTSLRAPYRYK